MARKNRASVYDGVYHVTTRVANKAMLLEPDEVKEALERWIVDIAEFSGVEVWNYTIMDNHLHLVVHVPPVPAKYWTDPDVEPDAFAFGMRPPECRVPIWSPDGDCPPPQRPSLGFMLDDEEMVERLVFLYGRERAEEIAGTWAILREHRLGHLVDEAKERYCRRMYNLSQYLKTLKERVSMWYNRTHGREGCLWEGRFYSGVLDRSQAVLSVVSGYVAYNPVKAGIASAPAEWRWSSYSHAVNDADEAGARCRRMYERMFGRPWEDVREMLEAIFADMLPPGVTPEQVREWFDDYDEDAGDRGDGSVRVSPMFRASQVIRVSMKVFRTGAYISADLGFVGKVRSMLPPRFPACGKRSVKRCRAFFWDLPERSAA